MKTSNNQKYYISNSHIVIYAKGLSNISNKCLFYGISFCLVPKIQKKIVSWGDTKEVETIDILKSKATKLQSSCT